MQQPSTPTRKIEEAKDDLNSPQVLIKSFLKAKLPDFSANPARLQFPFLAEESNRSMSQFLETCDDTFLSDASSVSSSVALSLPESFEASHLQPLLSPKTQAKYDSLVEKKTSPMDINKNLPLGHASNTRRNVSQDATQQIIAQQLSHITALEAQLLQYQTRISYLEEQSFQDKKLFSERMQQLQAMFEQEKQTKSSYEDEVRSLTKRLNESEKAHYQMKEYEALYASQKDALASLAATKERLAADHSDLLSQNKLLSLDKAHLLAEKDRLAARLDAETAAALRAQEELAAAGLKIAALQEKIVETTLTAQQTYDEKLRQALQTLQDEAAAQRHAWRDTHDTLADRDARLAAEAQHALAHDKRVLREENQVLQERVFALQQQLVAQGAEKQAESAALLNEVRLKTFELASFAVTFEERMQQLRTAELSLERCEKELRHYQVALAQLEQQHHSLATSSEQELDRLRTQLAAYEALETQIDAAVMRTAATLATHQAHATRRAATSNTTSNTTSDTAAADEGVAAELPVLLRLLGATPEEVSGQMATATSDGATTVVGTTVVPSLPTHPQRRLRQTLSLAQDVLRLDGEAQALRTRLAQAEGEVAQLAAEKAHLAETLAKVSEPQTALVQELKTAKNDWLRLQHAHQALSAEHAALRHQHAQVKERLAWLLQQRDELRQVKVMLAHLHHLEVEAREEEDDSDEEVHEEVHEEVAQVAASVPATPPRSPPVAPLPHAMDAATSPLLAVSARGAAPAAARDLAVSAQDLARAFASRLHVPVTTMQQMLTPPAALTGGGGAAEGEARPFCLSHNGPGSYSGILQLSHTRQFQ